MSEDIIGLTNPDKLYLEEKQKMMMQQGLDNPFESPQYQKIRGPDTPVNYGGGMAEILLSDNDVPETLRKKYWFVFNKDNVLTFLDEPKKQQKMMSFDISIIDQMNTMQSYDDYTFETELQYNLMRNALDVKFDRAVGTKSGTKNERIVLQSQFSEARQINELDQSGDVKQGFFKRLLGRK